MPRPHPTIAPLPDTEIYCPIWSNYGTFFKMFIHIHREQLRNHGMFRDNAKGGKFQADVKRHF